MKANYHTHTWRCGHATGTEEDYVRAALEAGLSVLGFTDHAPFPDAEYPYRMAYEELEDYFSGVDRVKREYASRITIRKGLEIEYLPQNRPFYEALFSRYQVDYLLLGEHFFRDKDGSVFFITSGPASTEVYLRYARAVSEALDTGLFRMIAHADIFAFNPLPWDRNCDAATDIILDAVKRNHTILEWNAGGIRRGILRYPDGLRYAYPHLHFWDKVPGSGIPVVVGSDCHEPAQVWDTYVTTALGILQGLGITPCNIEEGNDEALRSGL